MIALFLALLAAGPVQVQPVVEGGRPALRVAGEDLQETTVTRDAAAVHVCFVGASAVEVLPAAPGAPAIASGTAECGQRISIEAEEGLPFEVRREPGLLLVLLGEEPLQLPTPAESSDMIALMAQLWPGRTPPEAPDTEASGAVEEQERLVLRMGPLELRPLLTLFASAQTGTLEDVPEPSKYGMLILEPGLRATTGLLDGRLQLQYVPTFRGFRNTSFDDAVSHHANGRLGLELLPLIRLDGYGHFAKAELETREVDPGYEYFFGLRPFTQYGAGAVLGYDRGGLADVDLSLDWRRTDLQEETQFFDNDQWFARAQVRRELGAQRTLALFYGLGWADRVPGRVVAQSDVREIGAEYVGELRPLWPLRLMLAWQTREHEFAPGASRDFTGLVAEAGLSHQFARGLTLELTGQRETYLSAFEDNGYYVNKGGRLQLSGGLPLQLRFVVAGGFYRNDYPLPAAALGVPRRDDIKSFSIGLSRNVRDSIFIRLDYHLEERDSNLPGLSNRTGGFMFGVGFTRRKELL